MPPDDPDKEVPPAHPNCRCALIVRAHPYGLSELAAMNLLYDDADKSGNLLLASVYLASIRRIAIARFHAATRPRPR